MFVPVTWKASLCLFAWKANRSNYGSACLTHMKENSIYACGEVDIHPHRKQRRSEEEENIKEQIERDNHCLLQRGLQC